MWKRYGFIQIIVLFGLMACSEPASPITPTVVNMVEQTAVSATSTPLPEPTQTAVSPAEANPSQITPSPLGEATPHVAPQPGVPGDGGSGKTADTVIALAIDDLANHLNASPEKIAIVSVNSMEWPNSALGCPLDGMDYLMVITPGFVIVLEADGEQYIYHTDDRQTVVLCAEQN